MLVTCCRQAAIGWRGGAGRGLLGGAGAGSCRYCLVERPGAPPRAALRAARPRRSECCESNVGLVPSGRRGQFLKGQPSGAHSFVLRRPPLGSGTGRRKTAGSARSGRSIVRTPRREQRSPRVVGRLPVSQARPLTLDRHCGFLRDSVYRLYKRRSWAAVVDRRRGPRARCCLRSY